MDKVLHFAAGMVCGLIGWHFFGPIQGVALAVGVGIAKEIRDWYCGGTFDAVDAAATAVGGAAAVGLLRYFAG